MEAKKTLPLKTLIFIALGVVMIIGAIVVMSLTKKTTGTASITGQGDCSQYSNKDGYTGCMSLMNGKEKKCKFRVDNKVNETTQKMEFKYSCLQK